LCNDYSNKLNKNIDSQKVIAERLNGYSGFFGYWSLIGAYATTGQIIPGCI